MKEKEKHNRIIKSAYYDCGWILFDDKGEVIETNEWPQNWPKKIDRLFLKNQDITVIN